MKRKNPNLKWFNEARFGLFIHWGIYSIPAKGEWSLFNDGWDYEVYESFAKRFNPVDYDPSYWAKLAKAAGMKYVVFTTKHHDSFSMFDTKQSDYNIMNTPYGKDITAELVKAFRAEGLKIGFYHSLVDWRHPHFIPDPEHPAWKRGERDFSKRDISKYRKYLYSQVEEILTNYGKIDLLFFDYTSKFKDGSEWEPKAMLDMIYRLQPEIIVNDRLCHEKGPDYPGDYCTPEISVPNLPVTADGEEQPWETCMTMNSNWGYNANDNRYKSPSTILKALCSCVSRSGNLLLNVGPDARGNLTRESVAVLEGMADWMKYNGEAIHGAGKSVFTPPPGCVYTQKGKDLYLHLMAPAAGDVILPELDGKIEHITLLDDGSDVPMITFWGKELLKKGEIRIRPPFKGDSLSVLKIRLKD